MSKNEVKAPMRLLYITTVDVTAGDSLIAASSRINIGVLSRDFDVSLAVVGPVTTTALNRLRLDLGPTRVTGAFEPSKADRHIDRALRKLSLKLLGTDMVSARLQAAIERKAEDFQAVIIDHVLAWPYRPAKVTGTVCFTPKAWFADAESDANVLTRLLVPKIADYELAIGADTDTIITPPELAMQLSDRGVPLSKLQPSFSRPAGSRPSVDEVTFPRTANRIGYVGYLGDDQNTASLLWFLDNVWPLCAGTLLDVELHLVGTAPNKTLERRLAQFENVVLHWGSSDALLFKLGCRVVVEPLVYETHVDAKMINAMARGIPTVTTLHALNRAHSDIRAGITAADTREDMVFAIKQLMTDAKAWKQASVMAAAVARPQLADFEVAHAIRRELVRYALAHPLPIQDAV
jgi:hypothetical protein